MMKLYQENYEKFKVIKNDIIIAEGSATFVAKILRQHDIPQSETILALETMHENDHNTAYFGIIRGSLLFTKKEELLVA